MKGPKSTIGVRDLRQNLSVYLRRVKAGDVIEVTERGQRVAVLPAGGKGSTILDRLIATALALKEDLGGVITYDARLSAAARRADLEVLTPV